MFADSEPPVGRFLRARWNRFDAQEEEFLFLLNVEARDIRGSALLVPEFGVTHSPAQTRDMRYFCGVARYISG